MGKHAFPDDVEPTIHLLRSQQVGCSFPNTGKIGTLNRLFAHLPDTFCHVSACRYYRSTAGRSKNRDTGLGLTAPNGNSLAEYRQALLTGQSGVSAYNIRYIGDTLAGICKFDALRHQNKKDLRRGTRAGSVSIYCSREAIQNAGLDWPNVDKSRVGVYFGITEHGNVETENEIYNIKQYDYDTSVWTHHHNPRTVANNPAGEAALNLGITGPHYTIGAACAAGMQA